MKGDGDAKCDRPGTRSPSGGRTTSRSPMQDLANSRSSSHHKSQQAIHHTTNGDHQSTTNGTSHHKHKPQTKLLRDSQQRAISTELGELRAPGETKTSTEMAREIVQTEENYKSADSKAGLNTVITKRILKTNTTITRGENEKVSFLHNRGFH